MTSISQSVFLDLPMDAPSTAVRILEGESPLVVSIDGPLDAAAQASLEVVMRSLRRAPRDVVFDVAAGERLDVEGLLLLAHHAQWLRQRSCHVVLRGAAPEVEQLARLLGYERALGLA